MMSDIIAGFCLFVLLIIGTAFVTTIVQTIIDFFKERWRE